MLAALKVSYEAGGWMNSELANTIVALDVPTHC